jgi:hypothetical protein
MCVRLEAIQVFVIAKNKSDWQLLRANYQLSQN